MSRFDVTAVGEVGLRLSVPSDQRLARAASLDLNIAGTEANVLAGLSSLGWRTSWVSALPNSPMAGRVEYQLRSFGVDLTGVTHPDQGRLGIYYVEYGAAPRPTQVYFDRANTAFTNMTVADVDWDLLLDTRIIHLTGITAALSPTVLAILTETVDRAEAAGIPIAFDVNYRANLWAPDVAATTLRPFIERAEILFVRSEDLTTLYGFSADSAEEVLENAMTLSSAPNIVMTCGVLGARACLEGTFVSAPARPVDIIDRLGAGDGFAAGFLHAWLDGRIERGLEYGTAMAALALAQVGEQVQTTREELASILTDSTSNLRR